MMHFSILMVRLVVYHIRADHEAMVKGFSNRGRLILHDPKNVFLYQAIRFILEMPDSSLKLLFEHCR